jgi:hypothetical protein
MSLLLAVACGAVIVVLFALVSAGALAWQSAFSGMFAVVGVAQLVTAAGLVSGRLQRESAGVQSARGQALWGVGYLLIAGLLAPFWELPVWVSVPGLIAFILLFGSGLRLERRARRQQVAAQGPQHA